MVKYLKSKLDIAYIEEKIKEFEQKNSTQGGVFSAEKMSELLKAFDEADVSSKKLLIRSLLKSIEVYTDRKLLKRIVFWNSEDSTIFSDIVLPQEQ